MLLLVGVHSPNAVITPYDISIESVSKHGKEVKCTWWESVNENVLYDVLTKEVNDLMYNLRGIVTGKQIGRAHV